jgi:hypothetical protein
MSGARPLRRPLSWSRANARMLAVICFAIGVGLLLVVVPLFAFLSDISTGARVPSLDMSPSYGDARGIETFYVLKRFDPTTRNLSADLYVFAPFPVKNQMKDDTTGKHLYACVSGTICNVQREFHPARVQVYLATGDSRVFQTNQVNLDFPLEALRELHFGSGPIARATKIELLARSGLYPGDSYGATLVPLSEVTMPGHPYPPLFMKTQSQWATGLLTRLYDVSIVADQGGIKLSVTRPLTVEIYVYALSFLPFWLGVFLLVGALVARERFKRGGEGAVFMLGAVAAMLTTLPLRLVLVPPDVPGLTRVDFILAAGLGVIVLASIAWYVLPSNITSSENKQRDGENALSAAP